MATYSTIKGFTIQSYATDPGQAGLAGNTWSVGNSMNTARGNLGGCGTQTAGLIVGGKEPANSDKCETFDGTSWTETNNINTARGEGSAMGTTTAAVFAAGFPGSFNNSETWNGTSWSEGNNITTGRGDTGAVGTSTAGLLIGGWTGSVKDECEEYDGTCWTESGDLGTGRYYPQGFGSQTAALAGEGGPLPTGAVCETYNGSTWSSGTAFNTARMGYSSAGTTKDLGLACGGDPFRAVTESWDGTAWTERNDLNSGRSGLVYGPLGTQTAAICCGGSLPGYTNQSEEFSAFTGTFAQEGQVWYNTTSTVLKGFGQFLASGTWASGAGMAAYANGIRGFGTQTAAVGVGFYGPSTPLSYTYNGTAWSSINGLVNAPGRYYPGGTGTTTAGICFGEEPGKNNSETYDGTSWTEGNNLTTGRNFMASGGTSTAAFGAAGYAPGYTGKTEIWNGTSWSEDADVPVGVQGPGGNGSVTAAIIYSGIIASPATTTAITYTFDGTTWSDASADVNTECSMFGSAGPQTGNTAALKFGGETHPGKTVNTELYDGSTWTEVANIANGRRSFGGAGTTASALFFGGEPPSGAGLTEEWSVTPSIKTFTAS